MGDPAHVVQIGRGHRVSLGERQRRAAVQGGVAACRVVVGLELAKLPFKITAIPEQHMVEEFSTHRPNEALHEGVGQRCALEAHGIQSSEMTTAAKLSSQPRTESCVVAPTALRSVDREVVGRNVRERKDNPEIDRGRSSRPYLSMGKAETQAAVGRVTWDASGVRTAGMQPKDSLGTRESRPIQAMTCKVRQADTARET